MRAQMNIHMTDKIVSNRHGYDVKIRGRVRVMVRFRVVRTPQARSVARPYFS